MPLTFPFSFFNFHFPVRFSTWYILSRHKSFFQKSKFMIIIFLNLPHWKLNNYIEIETEKIRGHCALFKSSKCLFRAYYKFTLHLSKQPSAWQKKIIYIYTVLSRCTLVNQETQHFKSDQKYILLVKLWPFKSQ